MFEIFSNSKISNKKRKLILSKNEQNDLMLKISQFENFREAEVHFNRLYDSLVHPLWANLSNKYIPPLSDDDLRDIFQEAWIKLLEMRTKYNGKSDVFNWVYTIKKNLIIDHLRKQQKYNFESLDTQREEDEENPLLKYIPHEIPFEQQLAEEEKAKLIMDALENLQDVTIKELLKRRILLDHKLEKISEDLDIPLTTVFKKIKKGLSIIKPEIENILNS